MKTLPRADPLVPVCVLAVSAPLLIAPPLYDQVVMPRLALTFALTGLALCCATATRLPMPDRTWRKPAAAAAAFLIIAALSTALGVDPRGSLIGEFQRYQGTVPLAVYILLMFVTANAVTSPKRLRLLVWSVVFGGAGASVYALLDVAGWDWIEWSTGSPQRAGGLFAQPNVLGTQLAVCAVAGIGLVFAERGWRQQAAGAATGTMLAVLILTMSRGGWVAATTAIPIFLVLSRSWSRRQAGGAVAVGLLAVAIVAVVPQGRTVLNSAVARAEAGVDVENQSTRLGLWRLAIEMWQDHPVVGSGPDSFSVLFPQYRKPDQPGLGMANVRPESAHNFFLDHLVGVGAAGIIAFATLFMLSVLPTVRGAWPRRTGPLDPLPAAVAAGLGAYFIAVFFSFSEAMTGWLPWVLMGGLIGMRGQGAKPHDLPPAKNRTLPRPAGVGGMVLGAGVAAAGGLLLVSDWNAGKAASSYDESASIGYARDAGRLNPLVPGYVLQLAEIESAAGRYGQAARSFHRANQRFAPTAYSLIGEANALFLLDPATHREHIQELLTKAEALDPYNAPATDAIRAFREAWEPTN